MEIQNYKPIGKGCLVGKFDICVPEWGGLTICDCVLFAKDGKRWVGLPSREYQAKDGQKKHFNLVKFKPEVFKKLQEAALVLLEKLVMIVPQQVQESIGPVNSVPF